ncbi:DamX protein [Thiobaca trueperi]|uniref:DamX protein n=2 Tax=Thiobaca trueperi TaxID=127458 RepID=A0A4R3MW58_9GAMM|nr:DamX protein [Thiobaca trueperi]
MANNTDMTPTSPLDASAPNLTPPTGAAEATNTAPADAALADTDATRGSPDFQICPATQGNLMAQVVAELARQKSALQSAESALIERIGDVDDDRRCADMRLQRAWQTQYGEMSVRVKRQGWFGAAALLVCGVVIGVILALFHVRFNAAQQDMREEIAQLRIALEQQRAPSSDQLNQEKLIHESLSRLSASIQAISASLATLDRPPEPAPAAIPADPSQIGEQSGPTETTVNQVADEDGLTTAGDAIGMTPATADPPPATAVTESPAPSTPPAEAPLIDTPDPEQTATNDQNDQAVGTNAGPVPTPQRILVGDQPYALQLIGFHSLDALQTFLDRFDLSSRVIYYREETYRGRPWFALIYSLHADREAAMAAIASLPAGLSGLDVWVRRLDPETPLVVLNRAQSDM